MIDFSTTIQRNNGLHEQRHQQEMLSDNAIALAVDQNRSDPIDTAREIIAAKPVISLAIAFVVGGTLGWLTSRR
jgi:ElaB/YqjD/DUF883 family membrane-anchored ribosome-binding protein